MAHIVMEMTAIGLFRSETCSGCDRAFGRGELMSAVEAEDGGRLGWFCRKCLASWPNHQNAADPPISGAAEVCDKSGESVPLRAGR